MFDSFPKRFTLSESTEIVEAYKAKPTAETVAELAARFNRSPQSIVAKLSYERVYVSKAKQVAESKTAVKTRIEYVRDIAEHLGLEPSSLIGLEKANLQTLKYIAEGFDRAAALAAEEFSS